MRNGNVKAHRSRASTRLGEFDSSGRRRPVPTEEIRRLDCDTVILAVGETVDLDFARASGLRIKEIRHPRSGPLHARNQPQQILRGRRRDHAAPPTSPTPWATARRRRAISTERLMGAERLGQASSPQLRLQPRRRPESRSASPAARTGGTAGGRARAELRRGGGRTLSAEEAAGRSRPLPALRYPGTPQLRRHHA